MYKNKYIDILIIGFIFVVLFTMPVLFVRVNDAVSWKHVFKIWQDNSLLIPVFAINHWILLPRLLKRKKFLIYFLSLSILIVSAAWICHQIDPPQVFQGDRGNKPTPIPPYANMLMYAILITGIDIGLFYSKMWHDNEQRRIELEQRNTAMELEHLRNQLSPHFFMNTLNNIYALVDCDTDKAKEAVMKLSKLMRYLLYENNSEYVKLSKEFQFVQSYVDLARIRYTDDVVFTVNIPADYEDIEIPPMLFVSYIENAVKHGVSYQNKCEILIEFVLSGDKLIFHCTNPVHRNEQMNQRGGIGLVNSRNRLKLLYGRDYDLTISEKESLYSVTLNIPVRGGQKR